MDSIQKILEGLTNACVNSQPSFFKPFLSSDKITSDWPDKESFYKFFKIMILNSKKMSIGKIRLKIKSSLNRHNFYEFYDSVHVHPILTLIILEDKDSLHIDILPF
jgi:hypothetical protein